MSEKETIHDCEMAEDCEDVICATESEGEDEDSIEEFEPSEEKSNDDLAEEKRLQGNDYYKKKDYKNAVALYTQAIELLPEHAPLYGNRSAAYVMLSNYPSALEDARRALQLDPSFTKALLREAKCHMAMGEVAAAIMSYQKVLQMEPGQATAEAELQQAQLTNSFLTQAFKCYESGDYRQVVYCMDRCLSVCSSCQKFRILKAECMALLGRYQEAQEIANDILRFDGINADGIYVRGMCLYYQDNHEKAFQHFQQVLRLAPDHSKARDIYKKAKALMQKKEEGNSSFRCGKLQRAYDLYTEALEIDPNNLVTVSKLHCNRAAVSAKLKKHDQAVDDCSKAISLDNGYLKAYLRRAHSYQAQEQFEEAVRDYEKIFKLDQSKEHKKLLQEAKLELRKSKRKDYYKILGVDKTATEDELKKAYRKRALLHHPDRHSHDTPEKQKEEEKKFKEIGEAFSVLNDPKKRTRFDRGEDLDDSGAANFDFDPNEIFQTFFSTGGPGPGFFGGGGQQFGGGGYPGGYTFQFG